MVNWKFFLKLSVPLGLAVMAMFGLIFPAKALIQESYKELWPLKAIVPGVDYKLSGSGGGITGSGSPDIAVNSTGDFIAATYFKISVNQGDVFLKTASNTGGWLTSRFIGQGSNPQLAFSGSNVVYVVWTSPNKQAIRFSRCVLGVTDLPACTSGTVFSSEDLLNDPDVVVDGSGAVVVVWESNGQIFSTRSTNNGQSWALPPSTVAPAGNNLIFQLPQIAFANNLLHLAVVEKVQPVNPSDPVLGQAIVYFNSPANTTTPGWISKKRFERTVNITSGYDSLDNPTIAANQATVYLAWEGHRVNTPDEFGLMRSTSTNSGETWENPFHIPSNLEAVSSPENPGKRSRFGGAIVPAQEAGLRPSLTISGTNNVAIVWQQRPADECEVLNGSSEIFFAHNPTTWPTDMVANDSSQYSIDPDLAVGPGGVEHFVFMKDSQAQLCDGGDGSEYDIFYRGPFENKGNDQGEEDPPLLEGSPGVYLPLITR